MLRCLKISLLALAAIISIAADDAAILPAPAPGLIVMAPLDVPIVDGGRLLGRMSVKLVLNCNPADVETVAAVEPQMRNALLIAANEFARLNASLYLAIDVAALSDDLTAAVRRAGAPTLKRVLIVEVGAQRA